jgi:DnaJ-class molecular chaperone
MSLDNCGVCGGDGRLSNSFGNTARCPACHGTGRRSEDTGFHDVTKTKAAHHQRSNGSGKAAAQTRPSTFEGAKLAEEIQACTFLSADIQTRLTREIIEYEGTHGRCTDTFTKKIRRQLRVSS